jgi:uncharacterized secreted repeat protein (TIGR03808 family)
VVKLTAVPANPNDPIHLLCAADARYGAYAGIMLGFGHYLRDVAATGNVVRKADIGIAVSVAIGAGTALIADNVIAEFGRGAIMGMDRRTVVTGDLAKGGGEKYAHLTISGNRAR